MTIPGLRRPYWILANNAKCHGVPARQQPGSSSGGHLEPKSPKTWWGVIFRGGFFFQGTCSRTIRAGDIVKYIKLRIYQISQK